MKWCEKCKHYAVCALMNKKPKCFTDRKDEPTISKMEQVDKDINVPCKDEPQTKGDQHVERVEYVETMSCQECKRWIYDDRWGWFCPLKSQDECKYEPKTELQAERSE